MTGNDFRPFAKSILSGAEGLRETYFVTGFGAVFNDWYIRLA